MSPAQKENEPPAMLVDTARSYLDAFHQHSFKALDLKDTVPLRPPHYNNFGHTDNLTRYTQDATGLTGQSDSGPVMDPDDKDRAAEDLKAFKGFVSSLKFAYHENQLKIEFVNNVLSPDGPALFSAADNDKLEKERLRTKGELRAKKQKVKELEGLIRKEAEEIGAGLEVADNEAALAAELLQECEAMELELAGLRNKRTATQRITLEEAQVLCEEQEMKLASYAPASKAVERTIKETNHKIKAHKSAIEKLAGVQKDLRKEQDEREAKGKRDEKAEQRCRWITNATAIYSSLLGIRSAYTVGSPVKEMRIEYESPQGQEGDIRTLSVALGEDGKMLGATLLNSSDSIEDIVEAFVASQDLPLLVQEVRARIGC